MKKRGKTVVITSHLLSDIEDICDRVIILYGGKIRATGSLNELLTVTDENRITTPALPPAAMARLVELLRSSLDGENFRIDHPRRSLEEFFLDVIARAKSDSVETAGVVGGGKIAEYLAKGDESSAVLETLIQEVKAPEPAPEPSAEPEKPAEKAADLSEKLEVLTEGEKPQPVAPPPPAESVEEKKLDEVNAKLNDILGTRK